MSTPSTILVTGADGQLGYELQASCPNNVQLVTSNRHNLDISDSAQIQAALQHYQPDYVINAAAYTAVDKAESDTDNAYAINAQAPELLAAAIAQQQQQGHKTRLVHVSTDFVFAGTQATPYAPNDTTQGLGVYGASKLAGEQAVQQHLPDALIIRTSWLYSAHGHNFVKSMLRLMHEKEQLGIVYDQVGSPTWARTLAVTIWQLMTTDTQGVLHCSDNGVASWYDFAVAIQEEAIALGLLANRIPIKPIRSAAYPTPAQRPAFSVMDKQATETALGYTLPYWRHSLRAMLRELQQTNHS